MFLELFGVICGFIYLYLEIKHKQGMWLVGLLMAIVYAIVYFQQGVYASMSFQIYYVIMSIYGFFQWKKDVTPATNQIYYRSIPTAVLLYSIVIYCAVTAFMVLVLNKFTQDPMPFADSSITVISAIATFWLSKSYREQWLAWLLVNSFTVIMSFNLHLYPTAILYSVNAIASLYGYFHWKNKGEQLC